MALLPPPSIADLKPTGGSPSYQVLDGVRFDYLSSEDNERVKLILKRAKNRIKGEFDSLSFEVDMVAAHSNGCPLDFEALLGFDDFNFLHDVLGVRSHIDRGTGKLCNFFVPRCAA